MSLENLVEMESFWKNKKVLLTGHNGFKGCWLLIWLINLGAEVWGISLPANQTTILFNDVQKEIKNSYSNIELDINEEDKLNYFVKKIQPDIVIHLAAQALVIRSYKEPLLTWKTNVIGSLNLLESLKNINKKCSIVIVTTDKVYKNKDWDYGYRENDELGGSDPYSASKSALEILVNSWIKSYCGIQNHQINNLYISTARSGNVIGGGDWADNRIVPDLIKSIVLKNDLVIRNPNSTRPWQHVLDPLYGYLSLAKINYINEKTNGQSYNFGPLLESNKSVSQLVESLYLKWGLKSSLTKIDNEFYESKLLNLNIDKAYKELSWQPRWNYEEIIDKTINWYKKHANGNNSLNLCLGDIKNYSQRVNI